MTRATRPSGARGSSTPPEPRTTCGGCGYSPTPMASTGRERSARRVGSARASSASSAETPRIAASWSSGTCGRRLPVSAWLSGSSAVAAIARPRPEPDRDDQRRPPSAPSTAPGAGSRRRGAGARARGRAAARSSASVFTTAIDVNAKMIATNSGPSQRLRLAVGVGRACSARPGRSPAAPDTDGPACAGASPTAAGSPAATRIVPSSGAGLVAGRQLGGEQGVAEPERAACRSPRRWRACGSRRRA